MVHWDVIGDDFLVYLRESKASDEAKRRGLKGIGYGRYVDPADPQTVVAKTVNGQLVMTPQGAKHPSVKRPPSPAKKEPQTPATKLDTKPEPHETDVKGQRIIGGKDKTLRSVDTSKTKTFLASLKPSNKEFAVKNKGNWLTNDYKKLGRKYKSGKFAPRYVDVLERMLNSEASSRTARWSYFSDIPGGQGRISAQAGEMMTMMGVTMDDAAAERFYDELIEHVKQNKKQNPKGKSIVDISWIKSARNNRRAILNRLRRQYGPEAEVVNAAWDTEGEVEALGLQNYHDNKGFSTDVYFKVRTSKGEILDEVSLKKDVHVNFLNSGTGKFIEWDPNLPAQIDPRVYSKKQTQALQKFTASKLRKIQNYIKKNPNSELAKTMRRKKITDVSKLAQMKRPNRAARKVMLKAVVDLARAGDPTAKKLLGASNSAHRKYAENAVIAISKNRRLQKGMLDEIRNEFPLKAVAEGEESMAIGPYSMDPKVVEQLFGTRDFEIIKERLVSRKGPPPFIAYQAGPKKFIPIAEINIREDGVGYGGSIKFEMTLDNRFAKELKEANKAVYGA